MQPARPACRVYACTIDSTPRMVFELADHGVRGCACKAAAARGQTSSGQRAAGTAHLSAPAVLQYRRMYCHTYVQVDVDVDTILMDEAGCVAEMAVPPLIKLAPANLVLVGDHLQLPAYSDLVSPPPNHVRRSAASECDGQACCLLSWPCRAG